MFIELAVRDKAAPPIYGRDNIILLLSEPGVDFRCLFYKHFAAMRRFPTIVAGLQRPFFSLPFLGRVSNRSYLRP
jgi:hypothetical protein